jgi:O-antigen ligase
MKKLIIIAGALVAGIGLIFLLGWQPLTALGAVIAIGSAYFAFRNPIYLLYGALASVALGQLGRIPPLQGGAPLIADVLLAAFFVMWLVWSIWKKVPLSLRPAHIAWYGFLLVALVALIFSPYQLGRGDFITALLYWVRLLIYSSLLWIVPSLATQPLMIRRGYSIIMWTGLAMLFLGVLQLIFVPDIGFLSGYGWDPHVGRFVSTFLDPNYLGGYLALLLSFFFALNVDSPRWWLWLAMAATVVAGLLTYSRSGYLSMGVVLVIIGLRYSWKLLLVAVICITPLALSIPRVAERVQGGINIDVTAQDRIDSWNRAFVIIKNHPLLGVGYNAFDNAQKELNLVSPIGSSLASGGSDSSLLNVAATTGIVGFILFILSGILFLVDAFRIIQSKVTGTRRVAAYVILVATPALLVNALFVNALFYPLILIMYAYFIGALYTAEKVTLST